MGLEKINSEYFNKGVFLFQNGKYLYIEEIQYSYDTTYWENTFIPYEHQDPRDATNSILGHKYRRVRHAGDEAFQLPEYIVAEDGANPIFKVEDDILWVKYEGEEDSSYTELLDLEEIKGDTGERGAQGDGVHIDEVGYLLTRRDCCDTLVTSSCNTCSPTSTVSTTTTPYLFLSLGDGARVIVVGDVGDFKRCNDTDPWVEIVAGDVGSMCRYIADDAIGTGTTDYRDVDSLGSRGKAYVCSDGTWAEFVNLNTPTYMVRESATYPSNIGFLENFVLSALTPVSQLNSIVIGTSHKLEVNNRTLDAGIFKEDVLLDGLHHDLGDTTVIAKADDFAGFGLAGYVSTADGFIDLQVDVSVLVSDGIDYTSHDKAGNEVLTVDGESPLLLRVNVIDFIASTVAGQFTGLEASVDRGVTETDGWQNMYVKPGDAILIDVDGVNVKADELSLVAENLTEIAVKEYNAGNDGILAAHLNPDAVNEDAGLELDNTTGIAIKLDPTSSGLDYTAAGLKIGSHAVEGIHLHSNIADTNKGIKMDTTLDLLEVMLQASGGLRFNASGGVEIDTSDVSWINPYVVKKIEDDNANDTSGDVAIIGDKSSDVYMKMYVDLVGQTFTVKPETNVVALQSLIDSRIASAGTGAHNHVEADITDLQDYVVKSEVHDNMRVTDALGIELKLDNTSIWKQLRASQDGNLYLQ